MFDSSAGIFLRLCLTRWFISTVFLAFILYAENRQVICSKSEGPAQNFSHKTNNTATAPKLTRNVDEDQQPEAELEFLDESSSMEDGDDYDEWNDLQDKEEQQNKSPKGLSKSTKVPKTADNFTSEWIESFKSLVDLKVAQDAIKRFVDKLLEDEVVQELVVDYLWMDLFMKVAQQKNFKGKTLKKLMRHDDLFYNKMQPQLDASNLNASICRKILKKDPKKRCPDKNKDKAKSTRQKTNKSERSTTNAPTEG